VDEEVLLFFSGFAFYPEEKGVVPPEYGINILSRKTPNYFIQSPFSLNKEKAKFAIQYFALINNLKFVRQEMKYDDIIYEKLKNNLVKTFQYRFVLFQNIVAYIVASLSYSDLIDYLFFPSRNPSKVYS